MQVQKEYFYRVPIVAESACGNSISMYLSVLFVMLKQEKVLGSCFELSSIRKNYVAKAKFHIIKVWVLQKEVERGIIFYKKKYV